MRFGEIEVTALCDLATRFPTPLREAFPDVPGDRWPSFRQRYPDTLDGDDGWLFHVHCYLVRTPSTIMLVDAGVGPFSTIAAQWIGEAGHLPDELGEVGVTPEEIRTVVITHLHLDHIGWVVSGTGTDLAPAFPNAAYLINRTEWESFRELGDEEDIAAFEEQAVPLQSTGVLELVEDERELAEGLSLVPAPGHTPGHQCLRIDAGGRTALISGDLTNHPVQVTEPNWRSGGDQDPALAAWTRRQWLERVEQAESILCTAHYPNPFSVLVRADGERFVSPLAAG